MGKFLTIWDLVFYLCVCVWYKALWVVPPVFLLIEDTILQFTPWAHKVFLLCLSGCFVSKWTSSTNHRDFVILSREPLLIGSVFFVHSTFTDYKGNLLFVKIKQSQVCISN